MAVDQTYRKKPQFNSQKVNDYRQLEDYTSD